MADAAAVQFLLDNLGQLVTHHNNLIANSRNEVEQLTIDLEYFNSFLKYASTRKLTNDRQLESMRQIRDVVYDVEDVVDAFVTQTMTSKPKPWIRSLFSSNVRLDEIARRVNQLRYNVEDVYGDRWKLEMTSLEINDVANEKFEVSPVREENVVGLENETTEIIGYLKQDTQRLDIISIVGMPGLGKSTLARKIFRDTTVQSEFPTRLWVYVSKFAPKVVFLSILREFTTISEDIRSMTESDLAEKVKRHLERRRFLIVMDGVWSLEDWSKISAALPTTNHMGKILITSRNKDVAMFANRSRSPHDLQLLSLEDSEKLLQCEVFGEPRWEPDFEPYGKKIAEKCNGLPLAIVVIGGIIAKKLSSTTDPRAKLNAWKRFSERVPEYLLDDSAKVVDKVMSLSYDKLPHHLKPCFLYFGMFPNDDEIPTWKLFRMWIAEGFVQENTRSSLEETADSYLDELIRRNLVTAEKRNSDGKVKSCRIHGVIWDFCKKQAGKDNENFLEEIRKSRDGSLTPFLNDGTNYRRLCIHSDISEFVASKPSGRRVRSLVCFSKEYHTLEQEHISAIPGGFKLLRVLDVKPIKFSRIPIDMYELLHLRYIHLSFNSGILHAGFSRLWNLQTLIVETPERTLQIKADIWKMRRLRHVKTSAIATLPEPKNATAEDGDNNIIQTLGTISPENCTDQILGRARSLRRLSIRGKLEMLLRSGTTTEGSFDNMVKLTRLEKLKLQNDAFPLSDSESPLPCLPPSSKFPPNLKILTLSSTFLEWSQMKVLGSLENLEVLKLKEAAFMGNFWVTADGGFPRLEVLFIGRTDLVVWKMSSDGVFPNLRHLELHNCDDLREVPIEFAQKHSLRALKLTYCRSAAASADKIRSLKMEADATVDFKMDIFPPINK